MISGENKRNLPSTRARESLIAIRDGRAERVREISAGESAELFAGARAISRSFRIRIRNRIRKFSVGRAYRQTERERERERQREKERETERETERERERERDRDRETEREKERERGTYIIDAAGNYAARKRPLITPHSWITPVDGPGSVATRRDASRRPVPAQYRGEVARIMTDEGDVINGGPLLFYRRMRDEIGAGYCEKRDRRHSDRP